MADFERRQFENGLEFLCRNSAERNKFSDGSSEPMKDAQVIRVRGRQPHGFLNSNYLLFCVLFVICLAVCPLIDGN